MRFVRRLLDGVSVVVVDDSDVGDIYFYFLGGMLLVGISPRVAAGCEEDDILASGGMVDGTWGHAASIVHSCPRAITPPMRCLPNRYSHD